MKPEVMVFRAHERFDNTGALTDETTAQMVTELLSALAEAAQASGQAA